MRANNVIDQSLEDEWQRLENLAIPDTRLFASGHLTEKTRYAAKVMMALHFTRGEVLHEFRTIHSKVIFSDYLKRVDSNEDLIRSFQHELGRDPEAGELRVLVDQRMQALDRSNQLNVQLTAGNHNKFLELTDTFYVQRVRIHPLSNVGLLLGDSPVVISAKGKVSTVERPIAVGDCDQAFMPLSPLSAAFLSATHLPDVEALDLAAVRDLNVKTAQASHRFFVASRESDITRSLGERWWEY